MNSVLCIIPARGGSKGIPRKNVQPIAGKPLLAHSILQAKQTTSITRVLVTTDDDEIAATSREYGADVVPRPPEISGDTATSESALLHALDFVERGKCQALSASEPQVAGFSPQPSTIDLVVFLQATSPCRVPGEIQKAIDTLVRENADSLLSVGPVHGFVWRVERDGTTRSFTYDHLNRPRRQDAPEDLIENGSIYIFKPWVLRKFNNRLGGRIALHRMTALDSFQIDESGDFELLELIMRYRGIIPKDEGGNLKPENTDASSFRSDSSSSLSAFSFQLSAFRGIKLLALDFDGVLTDNRVLVSEDGHETVLCSREDGLGLEMLRAKGMAIVVISKEKNPVVTARCRKLGIPCIQGCDTKLAALQQLVANPTSALSPLPSSASGVSGQWSAVSGLQPDQVAYVGNDVNDLECLRWVGLPIAVADAAPEAISAAKYITTKPGGHGAVREVCDLLIRSVVSGQ